MKPKLLAFLEDLVSQERMIKYNENKYHENDISEELKIENEKKIRLCDEVLNEIKKELFSQYCFSLKSRTISIYEKKYKNKEDFKKDYLNGKYFYDKDSYENGNYISKKEIDLEKIRLINIFDEHIGTLKFDTKKLKFIKIGDI